MSCVQSVANSFSVSPFFSVPGRGGVAETLPELTGLDRRFAETKVQRGRVKLAHRVQRATALTRAFLDE